MKYKDFTPFFSGGTKHGQELDLIAVENGGTALGCSNQHFGHPRNLIKMGRAPDMGDGWETARHPNRPPILEADENGNLILPGQKDWSILRLGHSGIVTSMEIDTNHFKGNFPESCIVEACYLPDADAQPFVDGGSSVDWKTMLVSKILI